MVSLLNASHQSQGSRHDGVIRRFKLLHSFESFCAIHHGWTAAHEHGHRICGHPPTWPRSRHGLIGFVGGLVSSTAVTLSSASHARQQPGRHDLFAIAVTLASTIMSVRVGVEVAIVYPP